MNSNEIIEKSVHSCYWEKEYNCATTTLVILSKLFKIELNKQVIDSALGMHGAGRYGAQCGLVEGALMFFGIFGRYHSLADETIKKICYEFAESFENAFGSLVCRELRKGGFKKTDPPHLCEGLTKKTINFTADFIDNSF